MFSIYYDVLDIKIEGQILSSRLFRKRMLEATQRRRLKGCNQVDLIFENLVLFKFDDSQMRGVLHTLCLRIQMLQEYSRSYSLCFKTKKLQ